MADKLFGLLFTASALFFIFSLYLVYDALAPIAFRERRASERILARAFLRDRLSAAPSRCLLPFHRMSREKSPVRGIGILAA
jgi:hypothetical protein